MTNSNPPNDYPEAIRIAEHQLEMEIKDVLNREFETCWNQLKEDPAVTDPEAKMTELGDWFAEKSKAAITRLIELDPVETEIEES